MGQNYINQIAEFCKLYCLMNKMCLDIPRNYELTQTSGYGQACLCMSSIAKWLAQLISKMI